MLAKACRGFIVTRGV